MKVFLAGATGVIGAPLVEALLAAGHEVTGMTRSEESAERLREQGARAAVCDALDLEAASAAVKAAGPDVAILQLTALPKELSASRGAYTQAMEQTGRLRAEATPALVRAAAEAGARRALVQSISFITKPEGPAVIDEDASLYEDGPAQIATVVGAAAQMERECLAVPGIETLVLRYGFFYGPGSWYSREGSVGQMMRARRMPVMGKGQGVWSWLHVDDAVGATIAALERGAPGVYNVTDDDPAPMHEWAPAFAQAVGAKPPRRIPALLAKLAAGPMVAYYATGLRGASNARFKAATGWAPAHASWREGFKTL